MEKNITMDNSVNETNLVNKYSRFIQSYAKRYLDKGLAYEELIKAGMDGLTVAAQSYDPSEGFKFITYAMW